MTRIRYSADAQRDLAQIRDYYRREGASIGSGIGRRLRTRIDRLRRFPAAGRPGRVEGTRELVIPDLPYVVVYALEGEEAQILRVLHAAQEWPSGV